MDKSARTHLSTFGWVGRMRLPALTGITCMTVRRPALSPRWIGAQIGRFGAMLMASRQTKAATQIGGSRAAVVPHEVTFRDRGGRLRAAPDGCQRAESMIVDRPGRSSSPRFGGSPPTARHPTT